MQPLSSPCISPPRVLCLNILIRPLTLLLPGPLPRMHSAPKHAQQQHIVTRLQRTSNNKSHPKPTSTRQHPGNPRPRTLTQNLQRIDDAHNRRSLLRQDHHANKRRAGRLVHAAHHAAADEQHDGEPEARCCGESAQKERGREVRNDHSGNEAEAAGERGGEYVAESGEEPRAVSECLDWR